jgi:carbamate kinase
MAQGQFEEGTMLPKIQAAIDYIGDSAIRKVLITKLSAEHVSLGGEMGTMIGK